MRSPPDTTTHDADLEAARRHDEGAFERLIEPHRSALLAHCYRMLGSAADAEDALQDALLRAWRGLPGFEGRSSLRSWLYSIATNVCLKAIERRPKRVLPVDYGPPGDPHDAPEGPLVEPVWLEPYPDETLADGLASPEARYEQRESVELAFIAALQHLPARQRAVLLLRDVLGFAPAEIAAALDATPASIYSALQRAHAAVEERLPARSQQATLRALGDERLREVVERYVTAWEAGDVAAIVALLTDDATFAMPPRPSWYRGPRGDRHVPRRPPAGPRGRLAPSCPCGANGQPALRLLPRGPGPRAARRPRDRAAHPRRRGADRRRHGVPRAVGGVRALRPAARASRRSRRWIRRVRRISTHEPTPFPRRSMPTQRDEASRSRGWVLALASVASFMAALDTLVVTTALTTIRLDLGASIEQLEWTVNAYNLSFAVLLMTAAALGDRFGRRRMFAAGARALRARLGGLRARARRSAG